ncbi:MAG: Bax inhibitor-1 family protein [Puniceicoccales bacterium]|jgi:FtsH-binding integral membrane protein|nr:Bax inhibitor-1 family protein [Puniceicoccales bacterium]
MNTYDNPFVVAEASAETRAIFYRKAYGLVAFAIAAWAGVLAALFATGAAVPIMEFVGAGRFTWLIVLGVFWLATSTGQRMAFSESRPKQYLGLGIYIAAYAVLFVPIMVIVAVRTDGNIMEILKPAGLTTLALFGALTATVFMTSKDFSFLKTTVVIGSFVALGAILVFTIFGISPGAWFSVAMIALMSAAILWQTWQVKNQCHHEQYVGAAVVIFAGIMTLFWYVIQLFLSRRS